MHLQQGLSLQTACLKCKIVLMLNLRILIVDDETNQREMLGNFLARKAYRVTTAASAEDALKLLERNSFEIGLFDMRMSGMTGLELLKIVREKDPEMQVIVITAFGTVETAVEAMKLGAYDYLCKPVNLDELQELIKKAGERHYLLAEVSALRERIGELEANDIIAVSERFNAILSEVARVGPTDSTVLLTGESGTGKELIARTIHRQSLRQKQRFVAVNCAALPETLLESELLGHEKGAFTGADKRRIGRFEQAYGGTVFLDEIGELSQSVQVKLLRLLEERRFERLGGEEEVVADVRLITATNRNLADDVAKGRFREDLYYRINVVHLHLPSLRERREDIMPLLNYFIKSHATRLNRSLRGITPKAKDLLISYAWPGNVRELANAVERAVVLSRGESLDVVDFPQIAQAGIAHGDAGYPELITLRDVERRHIENVLKSQDHNLQKTAEMLGIHRNTLRQKLKEYGIERSE